MDMARLQSRPVAGGAPAQVVGVCARGRGGPCGVVVFSAGAAAPRVQLENRVPGAARRSGSSTPSVEVELSESRQGLRRPDAASRRSDRGHATAAQREGIGASRRGTEPGQRRAGGFVPYGLLRSRGGDLVGDVGSGELLRRGGRAASPFRVVPRHAGAAWGQRADARLRRGLERARSPARARGGGYPARPRPPKKPLTPSLLRQT